MPDYKTMNSAIYTDPRAGKNNFNDYRSKISKYSGETGIENVQSSAFSIRSKSPRTPQHNINKQ
jgi:hypothetical protein